MDGLRERCSLITGSLRRIQNGFMKYRDVRPLWCHWNRPSRVRSNWTFIYTRSSRCKVVRSTIAGLRTRNNPAPEVSIDSPCRRGSEILKRYDSKLMKIGRLPMECALGCQSLSPYGLRRFSYLARIKSYIRAEGRLGKLRGRMASADSYNEHNVCR